MSHRALAVVVPTLGFDAEVSRRRVSVDQYVDMLDALVLQGAADVSPASYGQTPLRQDRSGDPIRDCHEIDPVDGFQMPGKPVLGIRRGAQLINVAFGGTLFQDLKMQLPHASRHEDAARYDNWPRGLSIVPDSGLAAIYAGAQSAIANSIQHPSVDRAGAGLDFEVRCTEDGLLEAIRSRDDDFILGINGIPKSIGKVPTACRLSHCSMPCWLPSAATHRDERVRSSGKAFVRRRARHDSSPGLDQLHCYLYALQWIHHHFNPPLEGRDSCSSEP